MTIAQDFPEEDLGNLQYVRPYKADPLVGNRISLRCAWNALKQEKRSMTDTEKQPPRR